MQLTAPFAPKKQYFDSVGVNWRRLLFLKSNYNVKVFNCKKSCANLINWWDDQGYNFKLFITRFYITLNVIERHHGIFFAKIITLVNKVQKFAPPPLWEKVQLGEKVHLKLIHFSPLFGQILQIYLILDLF